jgi:hypothetical protein
VTDARSGAIPPSEGHIARLAAEFWQRCGDPPGLPRDPEPVIPRRLPVAVQEVRGLSSARAVAWATRAGIPAVAVTPDRRLRGCLIALRGRAFVLVDPGDPPDERRLTVAHELGHFLLEVAEPRARVVGALGPGSAVVLDGERPATFDERLGAILAGVPLAAHVHLMARDPDGAIGCARIASAECAADAFALELLAPRAALMPAVLSLAHQPRQHGWARLTDLLHHRFGLPYISAGGYARALIDDLTGGARVHEWLGLNKGTRVDRPAGRWTGEAGSSVEVDDGGGRV